MTAISHWKRARPLKFKEVGVKTEIRGRVVLSKSRSRAQGLASGELLVAPEIH